jgi:hypothetical protein
MDMARIIANDKGKDFWRIKTDRGPIRIFRGLKGLANTFTPEWIAFPERKLPCSSGLVTAAAAVV